MDLQDTEEGRFMEDVASIRDCPGPVTEVIASDGTRKPWLGGPKGLCGQRYPTRDARHVRRALACPECADKPAFKFLLDIGVDPRHLALPSR